MLDQYLAFIAPSPALFSLLPPPKPDTAQAPSQSTPSSYAILNSPSSSEQEIEAEIERIATGLFSVVATAGECGPECIVHGQSRRAHGMLIRLQDMFPSYEHPRAMRQRWSRSGWSRRFATRSSLHPARKAGRAPSLLKMLLASQISNALVNTPFLLLKLVADLCQFSSSSTGTSTS